MIKRLKYVFYTLTIWLMIHSIYIISDGLTNTIQNADVAIILGNKVNEDGTLSERLTKRLECGLELYKSGRVKQIIVSGGFGKEGYFEGTKMKEFLQQNNVPDSVIFVDNKGNNTQLTVQNTLKLENQLHFKSIIVVSQYYHLTRTKMLFRKKGFNNVSSESPNYFEFKDFYSIFREFFAYYLELF